MSSNYLYSDINCSKKHKKIEQRALIINIILSIALIVTGIVFFFFTSSSSILFDGVYSAAMTTTSIIALVLTNFTCKKSKHFPFGLSIFDNVFSLFKNMLVIIISILFAYEAINDLIKIGNNTFIPQDLPDINVYVIYISIVCSISIVIISIYFFMNKKIEGGSVILKAEIKSSIIDFLISFSIGIALLISTLVANNDNIIREIIDKSITITLITVITPFVFKEFIIELLTICGKRLNKKEEEELRKHLDKKSIKNIFIKKHNNHKIIYIFLDISLVKNVNKEINNIKLHLNEHYDKGTDFYFII